VSDFDNTDLLVEPKDARDCINERIEALKECPDHTDALIEWYNKTVDALEAIFASGAGDFFESNSGFIFAYFYDRPNELQNANRDRASGILKKLARQLGDGSNTKETYKEEAEKTDSANKIFVVHGHDNAAVTEVARMLEKLDLEPIVLREQPNRGATIIEKFEAYSTVGFAVVLMTSDDLGSKALPNPNKNELRPRARQNVILELGYFLGVLGRDKVCVLKHDDVEEPSDIFGVVYTLLDAAGRWQFDLVKELKAAGYSVNSDSIL